MGARLWASGGVQGVETSGEKIHPNAIAFNVAVNQAQDVALAIGRSDAAVHAFADA
jgi:hypothetical protein